MKKNVLQLIGSFHQGGSERQAVQLSKLLIRDGSVNVFVATLNREGVLLDELGSEYSSPIPEFKLVSFRDLNFAEQAIRCAKFLRDNRIDVIHTHDFYTNIFGMAAATIARASMRIASKRETGGMRSRYQDAVEGFAFRQAHRIVVNSDSVGRYLAGRGIDTEKISLIYNGVDLERLKPATGDTTAIRESLRLPTEGPIVTLVANLRHRVKNQPMFVRAAKRVLAHFPETHFVLAGEGELRGELESLASELGIEKSVHLIGRCDRVPVLLAASSIGVLTSDYEGFSNSILEYMAAALPVVATRVGGAAESITEGETGYLVEAGDEAALADRMLDLLKDRQTASAFGERGRAVVETNFSCAAQLRRTLEIYGV